ncbi:hypothetical protein GQ600_18204 [Phytophthora cactorum]|nr:hypothetical protein GQ600_18204 [Phytophthora cactorum]
MRVSGLLAILAATSTMAQDYTITFRSLKEEDSASSSLPSDSSFVFDGTNSDIAQQLYIVTKQAIQAQQSPSTQFQPQ